MSKTGILISCALLVFMFSSAVQAQQVALNPSRPDVYTVIKGDTLWDIASTFLQKPWQWPQVWHANQHIKNPHLIYPGDRLAMRIINGIPTLELLSGSVVKLSPSVRTSVVDQAIPAIPIDAIHQFLSRPFVMPEGALDNAPYVLDYLGEHLLGSEGHYLYVKNLTSENGINFDIVRPGGAYKDGDTGDILGYEALYLGSARLIVEGEPSKALVTGSKQQISKGDRLIPANDHRVVTAFYPKKPDTKISGSIISVLNGVSQIGQFYIVVLDRGEEDNLHVGDVLTILKKGALIVDKLDSDKQASGAKKLRLILEGNIHKKVQLPDEESGTLMVFRVFDRVSFGLIMKTVSALHVGDRVVSPE